MAFYPHRLVSPTLPAHQFVPESLQNRILQLSESDYTEFQDDASGSPAVLIMGIIALLVCTQILHCCIPRQSSLLTEPSLQDILERRRRRREEIRQTRLREMEAPSVESGMQQVERLQLTAEEHKARQEELLHLFEANSVQMVITQESLVGDKTVDDEDDEEKNSRMVRLPDRKPLQPDLVPNNCAICLESFAVGEIIVWSNNERCQHAFHQDCILEYLIPLKPEHDSPCPCCRLPFYVSTEEMSGDTLAPSQSDR